MSEPEGAAKKEVRVFGKPALASKVAMFQKKAEDHQQSQLDNPFSEWGGSSHKAVLSKDDPRYARLRLRSACPRRGLEIPAFCQIR